MSLQLFVGQLFVCLFVFIPQLAFPNACLASVFLYVGIILRQDLHIASYLASSVKILAAIIAGSTLAGVVVRHSPKCLMHGPMSYADFNTTSGLCHTQHSHLRMMR